MSLMGAGISSILFSCLTMTNDFFAFTKDGLIRSADDRKIHNRLSGKLLNYYSFYKDHSGCYIATSDSVYHFSSPF